jgi:4-amino-4-deoxy-L-arabinose transferase-like glycosyltransferase
LTWLYVVIALLKGLCIWLAILGTVRLSGRLNARHFLYALLGLALLSRVVWIVVTQVPPLATGDAAWYHGRAVSIAEGLGMAVDGVPTARFGPTYIVFLALLYKVFGAAPVLGQIANVIFSVAVVYLTYTIALELYDETIARTASLLMAIFPGQIPFAGVSLSEPMFGLLFLAGFLLSIKKIETGNGVWRGLSIGALYAAAALTRPVTFLYLPLSPLVTFIRGASLRKTITLHGLAFVGVSIVMAPWIYRNYKVFHAFIPATTFGGGVLWQGNNPDATGLPSDGAFQPHADIQDEVLRDSINRKEAVGFIKENQQRFARLFFARLYRTYEVDMEVAQSSLNAGRPLPSALSVGFIKVCNTFFNAMMLLFCAYMVLPLCRASDFSLRSWLAVLIPTAYFALMQAVFLAQDRYKYPTVPFIVIGVAVMLHKLQIPLNALWKSWRFRRAPDSAPAIEPLEQL